MMKIKVIKRNAVVEPTVIVTHKKEPTTDDLRQGVLGWMREHRQIKAAQVSTKEEATVKLFGGQHENR